MCSTRFTSIDIELSVQLFTVGCFTLSLPSKESSWRAMLLAYKIQQFDNFLQHKNLIRTSTRHNEMCNIYARNGIEITAVVSSVIIYFITLFKHSSFTCDWFACSLVSVYVSHVRTRRRSSKLLFYKGRLMHRAVPPDVNHNVSFLDLKKINKRQPSKCAILCSRQVTGSTENI